MSRILSIEPGKITRYHADGDKFHIQTTADVEPVLEEAKALHNEGHHATPGGDHHLASIPVVVLNAWAEQRGVTFDAVMQNVSLLREFLNDPDNSQFRIHKGAV